MNEPNEVNEISPTEIVLRCYERESIYDVVLTDKRLYWKKCLLYRQFRCNPLRWKVPYHSIPLDEIEAEITHEKGASGLFSIPYYVSFRRREDDSILFSFYPQNPIVWLRELRLVDVCVRDPFNVPHYPIQTFVRNNPVSIPLIILIFGILVRVTVMLVRLLTT